MINRGTAMITVIVKASDKRAVSLAASVLRRKGVIIYPTETAYGIAADATSTAALRKVNKIKKRSGKFMPVIVSDAKMAGKYIALSGDMRKLMRKFMPGPLTLVAKKKNTKTAGMLGGFRIPGDVLARDVARKFGKPITATSANMSGEPPIYKIDEIKKVFYGRADLIIDAGNLKKRKPSTVYDAERKEVIRKGPVSKKDIMKALHSANNFHENKPYCKQCTN